MGNPRRVAIGAGNAVVTDVQRGAQITIGIGELRGRLKEGAAAFPARRLHVGAECRDGGVAVLPVLAYRCVLRYDPV